MKARPVGLVLAAFLVAACSASGESAPRPAASPTRQASQAAAATATPSPTPTPSPEPTPAPTMDPLAGWRGALDWVLADEGFLATSLAACRASRPADVATIAGPDWPPDQVPAFGTLYMVVDQLIGPDGAAIEPGPPDASGWELYSRTYAGDAQVRTGGDIDALACVVLRVGTSATYGGRSAVTVHKAAAVVWVVDARTGKRRGDPWTVGAAEAASNAFPSYLTSGQTDSIGGLDLLGPGVTAVQESLHGYLGRVVPVTGGFQNLLSYYQEQDKLLPAGYELPYDRAPGAKPAQQTFVLRLVLTEPDRIAFIDVFCGPGGVLDGKSLRVAKDVPIRHGRFSAEGGGMAVVGEFRRPWWAEGTIKALDASARACGVPKSRPWGTIRDLLVTREGDAYAVELLPEAG